MDTATKFGIPPGALAERLNASTAVPTYTPMAFDFEAEPEAPVWAVSRVFEQGTLNILSGDTGAAKSILAMDLAVAATTGREWLGRSVSPATVLYLDEENPEGLVRRRLKALGMTNEARDELRYFNRQSIALDTPQGATFLSGEITNHGTSLVIVDTTTSTVQLDGSKNPEVAELLKSLRRVVKDTGATLVLLHHERKRLQGVSYDPSQAAIGARAWANQADAHGTLTRKDVIAELEVDDLPAGHRRLRSTFHWRPDTKGRGGEPGTVELVAVESEKDDRDRYVWTRATSEGRIEERPATDAKARQIAHAVWAHDGPIGRKQLARAVDERDPTNPSGTFTRALEETIRANHVIEAGRGRWTRGEVKPTAPEV